MKIEKQTTTLLLRSIIVFFGTLLFLYLRDIYAPYTILMMSTILGALLIDRAVIIKYADHNKGMLIRFLVWLCVPIYMHTCMHFFLDFTAPYTILTISTILGALLIDRATAIKYANHDKGDIIRLIVWLCAATLLLIISVYGRPPRKFWAVLE